MIICLIPSYSSGEYYCFTCAAKKAVTSNIQFKFAIVYGKTVTCVTCYANISYAEVNG